MTNSLLDPPSPVTLILPPKKVASTIGAEMQKMAFLGPEIFKISRVDTRITQPKHEIT